jgi:hypothetical protein
MAKMEGKLEKDSQGRVESPQPSRIFASAGEKLSDSYVLRSGHVASKDTETQQWHVIKEIPTFQALANEVSIQEYLARSTVLLQHRFRNIHVPKCAGVFGVLANQVSHSCVPSCKKDHVKRTVDEAGGFRAFLLMTATVPGRDLAHYVESRPFYLTFPHTMQVFLLCLRMAQYYALHQVWQPAFAPENLVLQQGQDSSPCLHGVHFDVAQYGSYPKRNPVSTRLTAKVASPECFINDSMCPIHATYSWFLGVILYYLVYGSYPYKVGDVKSMMTRTHKKPSLPLKQVLSRLFPAKSKTPQEEKDEAMVLVYKLIYDLLEPNWNVRMSLDQIEHHKLFEFCSSRYELLL